MSQKKRKVLVIAAHPDDEILGCGGTMAKLVKQGAEVHSLILGEGATSRNFKRDRTKQQNELSSLYQSAQKAGKILGIKSTTLEQFPDNRMDGVDLLDIIKVIEKHIQEIKPDTVFTHFYGDLNIDHQRAYEATLTACRPQPNHCVKNILLFEVLSSTDYRPALEKSFQPNWFEDIHKTFALKMKALKCYESEMRPWPHSRSYQSVETLSQSRGATAGMKAAEAFLLIRKLNS